ncbi:MAG: thioredoxin domain-containing protein [Gammaproteobacteria bacterium]|nr:thioredoxin domain-containing protein [Gammaproteobacteria bacterium]MCP5138119.1 thioredoxin domain-containing protein [Gammaproteobacteria bacterium]
MNRLSDQTSPYLLQHADNPVDWHPWGQEAIALARQLDKPILLSIGYSACHWCHVMAHESFEDHATAEVMNRLFVNIKVDREERPDLDKIYQAAHQLIARRAGGWPLTVFITPGGHIPFFAGTYFPPEPRYRMPGFKDILERVAAFFEDNKATLDEANASLIDALAQFDGSDEPASDRLHDAPLESARLQLAKRYEPEYGGFGQAPKFPHPTHLTRLLRHAFRHPDDQEARDMAMYTLTGMAEGGMYDQLGGGFCRYSTDDRWEIPHFEKMLYDNGPLLALYAQAWTSRRNPLFKRTAIDTADWVMREMQSPGGGYYSTLDADSEGEEGHFYVWTREQAQALLGDDYPVFARRYGLDRSPNFEGKWNLHVYARIEDLRKRWGDDAEERVEAARRTLFAAREQRIRPGRDEKILTAWNGLMIRGMAIAGRVFGRADFIESAVNALDFVHRTLWRDRRLLATCKDDRAHLDAYLDDYAFLLDGVLELLQARWSRTHLDFAIALADALLAHFQAKGGGFHFTADDHETLIHRPKPLADEATPSGNGIAALALNRLGHLLGEPRYLDAADAALKSAFGAIVRMPVIHCALLDALEEVEHPGETIILRGDPTQFAAWRSQLDSEYAPARMVIAIPGTETDLPGLLGDRPAPERGVLAYVCRGTTCSPPVSDCALFIQP